MSLSEKLKQVDVSMLLLSSSLRLMPKKIKVGNGVEYGYYYNINGILVPELEPYLNIFAQIESDCTFEEDFALLKIASRIS